MRNESPANLDSRATFVCLVLTLGALLSPCAAGQTTTEIRFTPDGIRSIYGKNVCEFQGEFPNQLGVFLDRRNEHAVQYRERDDVTAVFLLSKPTLKCGMVDAALDLTPLIRKGETVEFKCYTPHEGGTTSGKWGHVIGLANNENGAKRLVTARLAWKVDLGEKRFEEMRGQSITCDTSGYAD